MTADMGFIEAGDWRIPVAGDDRCPSGFLALTSDQGAVVLDDGADAGPEGRMVDIVLSVDDWSEDEPTKIRVTGRMVVKDGVATITPGQP